MSDEKTIERYGLRWPERLTDFNIDLWLWKHYDEVPNLDPDKVPDRHELVLRAIRRLYTPEEVTIDPWFEEYAHIWSNDEFATVWGSASCGKSNSFGLFGMLWWAVDPTETMVFLCSTTREMLELRIWESVLRHFRILERAGGPGKLSKQRMALINKDDNDDEENLFAVGSTVKACVKGVAVQQGSEEQARANLIGGHLPYVVLVIDEMQASRRAAVQARHNLSKGCKNFRFYGLANPHSLFDLSSEHAEPLEGWGSVNVESHEWDTRFGKAYHFDGMKSPAITEPDGAKKYPYLINGAQIDKDVAENHGNADAPHIYTFCRGWPPPQGSRQTVLTETELTKYHMGEDVQWRGDFKTVVGIDPAFSEAGDNAVLQVMRLGYDVNDKLILWFEEPVYLVIKANSPEPISEQLVIQVVAAGEKFGFGPREVAVDESGTQSFADFLETRWGFGVERVSFASRASDRPVSTVNARPAREVYADKVTEMWFNLAEFGRFDQIRGLPREAARQFCIREVEPKFPRRLLSKQKMKKTIGKSPDEGDACAICIEKAQIQYGIVPGAQLFHFLGESGSPGAGGLFSTQMALNLDIDRGRSKYLTQGLQ